MLLLGYVNGIILPSEHSASECPFINYLHVVENIQHNSSSQIITLLVNAPQYSYEISTRSAQDLKTTPRPNDSPATCTYYIDSFNALVGIVISPNALQKLQAINIDTSKKGGPDILGHINWFTSDTLLQKLDSQKHNPDQIARIETFKETYKNKAPCSLSETSSSSSEHVSWKQKGTFFVAGTLFGFLIAYIMILNNIKIY